MANQIDWEAQARMRPTIREMLDAGVPMTRENYLEAHLWGNVRDEIEGEDLPAVFQAFNQQPPENEGEGA